MGQGMTEFWESLAVTGPGGVTRFAADRLVARVARAKVETDDEVARVAAPIVSLTTLVCKAADADVRAEALRVLEQRWEGSGLSFQSLVLLGFREATAVDLPGRRLFNVPVTVTRFVVPRVVAYLAWAASEGHQLTERFGPVATPFPGHEVGYWLVGALVESVDDQAVSDLAGLLGETADVTLLGQLESRLGDAVLSKRDGVLWHEGAPTRLTHVLRANPHLPVRRQPKTDGTLRDEAPVLIALLQDRPDAVRAFFGPQHGAGAVNALIAGASMPAPESFVAACRQSLRELPPGEGREVLCRIALAGVSEALSAVADAGYLPAEERDALAFLFSTSQWEVYDRADPTGQLLGEYCATYAKDYSGPSYRRWLEEAAERAGRPNPCPPPPPPVRHGAIGSWPTDPGSFDGGGGFGGGY
ncbi:hypothetical protein [Tenggerimyces flavus]|uniref:Uncharacterized protein n=1 Tax=Tenggerimyces flavus TaxID=1708749 RepID=A0ABV7YIX0_9ACTN|nr:hypothetical protein [Tenggerimyces flavus]MBM7787657.1 hypothetical protein [Tenggerimyces flavus]